jgi:lysophospholipase L1-like esterase
MAYVVLGTSSVVATTGGFPVMPGACNPLSIAGATFIAAITSSGTATLTISSGIGSPIAGGAPTRATLGAGPIGIVNAKTWACFGDSFCAQADQANTGTGTCPFNTTNCFSYANGAASATWLKWYTGDRLSRPAGTANFGVTGQTTAQLQARIGAVLAGHYDIIVMKVGYNDIAAGVSCASIMSNLTAMWTQLLNVGSVVIQDGQIPSPNHTATKIKVAQCVNAQSAAWAQQAGHQGFYFVNLDPVVSDPTQASWTALTGYLGSDGIHPTLLGASQIAWADAQVINQLVPPLNKPTYTASDVYDATNNPSGNALPNGVLAGSGGTINAGCAGTVANSTSLTCGSSGGATVTGSQETINGLPAQVVTITGTYSSGASPYITVQQNVASPSIFGVGDTIQARGWLRVGNNGSAITNIAALFIQLGTTESGTNFNYSSGSGDNVKPFPTAGYASGGFVPISSPCRTLTAVPTAALTAVLIDLVDTGSPISAAATVEIAGLELRKGCL